MFLRISAVVALFLGLAACTNSTPGAPAPSIGCTIENAVGGIAALAIAQELQCADQAAIAASISAAASKAGICASAPALAIGKPKAAVDPKAPLKSIGSDICNSVASQVTSSLVDGTIPAAWACTNANATASIKGLVAGACAKVFP